MNTNLEKLNKSELIGLIRRRGMSITEADILAVRHERITERAHAMTIEAIEEMGASRGLENRDRWMAASAKFDKAVRLYELADEIMFRSLETR